MMPPNRSHDNNYYDWKGNKGRGSYNSSYNDGGYYSDYDSQNYGPDDCGNDYYPGNDYKGKMMAPIMNGGKMGGKMMMNGGGGSSHMGGGKGSSSYGHHHHPGKGGGSYHHGTGGFGKGFLPAPKVRDSQEEYRRWRASAEGMEWERREAERRETERRERENREREVNNARQVSSASRGGAGAETTTNGVEGYNSSTTRGSTAGRDLKNRSTFGGEETHKGSEDGVVDSSDDEFVPRELQFFDGEGPPPPAPLPAPVAPAGPEEALPAQAGGESGSYDYEEQEQNFHGEEYGMEAEDYDENLEDTEDQRGGGCGGTSKQRGENIIPKKPEVDVQEEEAMTWKGGSEEGEEAPEVGVQPQHRSVSYSKGVQYYMVGFRQFRTRRVCAVLHGRIFQFRTRRVCALLH